MALEFRYEKEHYRAFSSDHIIFVESLGTSSEGVRRFCLNWHEKRIVFTATLKQSGKPPGVVEYNWTTEKHPAVDLKIPTHNFSDLEVRREAARMAIKAMAVMLSPGHPGPGEVSIVKSGLSVFLENVLITGHI